MKPEELYDRVDSEITEALKAFRRNRALRRLQVDQTTWQYVSIGHGGEVILFLHGMAGAYDIWWQQIEALCDRYRLLSVTYPGVGSMEALSQGCIAILAQEGISAANVVGSSLGGYLAQFLVARHPDKVRSVVFANTFPPNEIISRKTGLVGKLLPCLPEQFIMYSFRRSVEDAVYPAAGRSELVRAYLLEQSYGKMSKEQFIARYRCVVEPFVPPDPQALGIPALIVEADNDPLVEQELREMLKATYPSATVRTLHGVGHFPYLNEPEEYAQLIEQFLHRTAHGGSPGAYASGMPTQRERQ